MNGALLIFSVGAGLISGLCLIGARLLAGALFPKAAQSSQPFQAILLLITVSITGFLAYQHGAMVPAEKLPTLEERLTSIDQRSSAASIAALEQLRAEQAQMREDALRQQEAEATWEQQERDRQENEKIQEEERQAASQYLKQAQEQSKLWAVQSKALEKARADLQNARTIEDYRRIERNLKVAGIDLDADTSDGTPMQLIPHAAGSISTERSEVVSVRGTVFAVENTFGYSVLQWMGGRIPSVGDAIVGRIDSYGMKDLSISGAKIRVFVSDLQVSRSFATKMLYPFRD